MSRRLSAKAVLDAILNLPEAESGGEESDDDSIQMNPEDDDQDFNLDSEDDNDNDDQDDGDNRSADVENIADDAVNAVPAADAEGAVPVVGDKTVTSRDGTVWNYVSQSELPGRFQAQNVFTAKSGLTGYCKSVKDPVDAFRLLIDDGMLRHIKNCTIQFARSSVPNWDMSDAELATFIGLMYLRGARNANNFPLDDLWSQKYGLPIFGASMARNRFREIKKYLRFDVKSTRSTRLQTDKFCMASFVFDRFVVNSQKCYVPEESLTIDEQLFPTKARCRFTQYMPNKPDKFGIKFWILAELNSKYCLNIRPYLGKDEKRTESLGTHVVMTLMNPYFNKGYNVTTDNFFTNCKLARKLLAKRTSVVGTVRLNRREVPATTKLALHESVFMVSGPLNLVKYQAKTSKTVALLSTLHKGASCETTGKKKPEAILYYNANKCGVDMLDSMCRKLTTKASCRRWPLAVFFNVLDIAGINAWIIYKKRTGSTMSRRRFLHKLAEELIGNSVP